MPEHFELWTGDRPGTGVQVYWFQSTRCLFVSSGAAEGTSVALTPDQCRQVAAALLRFAVTSL